MTLLGGREEGVSLWERLTKREVNFWGGGEGRNLRQDIRNESIGKRGAITRGRADGLLTINLEKNGAGIDVGVGSQEIAPGSVDGAHGGGVEGFQID